MDFNLSIYPAQSELIIKPGTTLTQAYDVENLSSQNLMLMASVLPWQPNGPNGSVTYDLVAPNPGLEFSLNNADLKLNQTFILKPNEKRQLVLKIRTDAAVPPGDSYYTFFISQNTDSVINPENSSAVGRIGSHLLLSLSPDAAPMAKAKLEDFSASPFFIDTFFTPVHFSGDITNLTDFYFKPAGKIVITKNDKTFKEIDLEPQNVLAHFSRNIQCTTPSCTISPPFWPGAYTATLKLDAAVDAKPVSITFFVFPYSLVAFILFLIFLFSLFRSRKSGN